MALHSRDYARDDGYSPRYGHYDGPGGGTDAPICLRLIIVTAVVFVAQIFSTRTFNPEEMEVLRQQHREQLLQYRLPDDPLADDVPEMDEEVERELEEVLRYLPVPRVSWVEEWCQLETNSVLKGQVWRLVTYAFCHDRLSVTHILFNMLFLWWFGPRLEQMYGSREFLYFYLTSAAVAGLTYVGVDLATGDPVPCIGASGAVMAVTCLFAFYFPRHKILVCFIIPVEVRWLVLLYTIYSLHPVLLALSGEDALYDQVAHAAHLGGLAFGFVYGKRGWQILPAVESIQNRLRGSVRRAAPRDVIPFSRDVADQRRMDDILQKIHEQGEASLSDRERRFLAKESERLKKRRR